MSKYKYYTHLEKYKKMQCDVLKTTSDHLKLHFKYKCVGYEVKMTW